MYTKLLVSDEDLKGPGFRTVNYFMANLDSVMNDIVAQETKPWLEFTIDNIYPRVVVDHGELDSLSEEDYMELGCLFEKSLGIGKGQVTDYLAKETLSFLSLWKMNYTNLHVGQSMKLQLAAQKQNS